MELTTDNLIQHLINWFNSNPKTEILNRYSRDAIKTNGDWILINVDSINVAYSSYFKRSIFQKNADLLSKKLIEVVKEWMRGNQVQVYHLKFKIAKQGAQYTQQGLIRI